MHEWPVDGLEARGNGRIICYDPNTGTTRTVLRGLKFPNGICIASDGQSILFAETFGCCDQALLVRRPEEPARSRWSSTTCRAIPTTSTSPRTATTGWRMVGMRSPALDLAWKMPGFRKRMAKRVPIDEWLFPNINTGCVHQVQRAAARCSRSFWDLSGENHPMITSMREHRGYLYLGGIMNNRIGRYKLADADPDFVQYDRRWGKAA